MNNNKFENQKNKLNDNIEKFKNEYGNFINDDLHKELNLFIDKKNKYPKKLLRQAFGQFEKKKEKKKQLYEKSYN